MIKLLFALLGFSVTQLSWAETIATMPAKINPEQQLVKVFIVMCVFVVVVLFFGILLKRTMMRLGIKTDKLKVIASIPLGAREKILLIQVGDKQYLLGATSYSIRTLCELDERIADLDDVNKIKKFDKVLKQVNLK